MADGRCSVLVQPRRFQVAVSEFDPQCGGGGCDRAMLRSASAVGSLRAARDPVPASEPAPADLLKDEVNVTGTMGLQLEAAEGGSTKVPGRCGSVKVKAIIPGGPANIEGTLEVGDVLVSVNGKKVREDNFIETIRGTDMLGAPNTILVNRRGAQLSASLTRTSTTNVDALATTFRHLDKLSALLQADKSTMQVVEGLRDHVRKTERNRLKYEEGLASRLNSQVMDGGLTAQLKSADSRCSLTVRTAESATTSAQVGTHNDIVELENRLRETQRLLLEEETAVGRWRHQFEECKASLEQCKGEIRFLEEENTKLKRQEPEKKGMLREPDFTMDLLDPDMNTWAYGSQQEREEGQRLLDELLVQAQEQVTEHEEVLRMQDQQMANQLNLAWSRESEQRKCEQRLFAENFELTRQRDDLQAKLEQLVQDLGSMEWQRDDLAKQLGLQVQKSDELRNDLVQKGTEVTQVNAKRYDLEVQLKLMTESAAEVQRKLVQERLQSEEKAHAQQQVMQEKFALEEDVVKLQQSSAVAAENFAYIHDLSSQVSDLGNSCVALSKIVQTLQSRRKSASGVTSSENVTSALDAIDKCLSSFVKKRTHCEVARGLPPSIFERHFVQQAGAVSDENIKAGNKTIVAGNDPAAAGVGILLHQIHRPNGSWQYFIKGLMPEGPAYETLLLREGDIVDFIDDQPLENVPFETVVDLVTGPEGSFVSFGLHRHIQQMQSPGEVSEDPEVVRFYTSVRRRYQKKKECLPSEEALT